MFSIDKEKFGTFVSQLRKEKGLTQKDLAEKLYVSDKAVSKWERGLSIPDVALLVPLAEILEVTVTELLEGRRISETRVMDTRQTDELVQKVIGLSAEESRGKRPRQGIRLLACILAGGSELLIMTWLGIPWDELGVSVGITMLLMVIFGLYFCILARQTLPKYYDDNRISSYSDGFFRMNLPGVYFNNNNWPHILKAGQLWCLLGLILTPVLYFLFRTLVPRGWQSTWLCAVLLLTLGGLFLPMVVVAKKYEAGEKTSCSISKIWRDFAWVPAVAVFVAILLVTGSLGSGSGLKVGWSERKGINSWSASYSYYDGWRHRTVNWSGNARILSVQIVTESGELDLLVTDQEGNILFSGDNIGTESIEIPITGKTDIRLAADKHKGSIELFWK